MEALARLQGMDKDEVLKSVGRGRDEERGGEDEKPDRLSSDDIRSLREEASLSQKQLAEKLDVSPTTISNWETGATNPRGKIRERLRRLREEQESGDSPASRIKQLREKAGLSQRQLAEELGVSSGTVSSWETGKTTPSELYVQALEQVAQGGG